MAIKGILFDFDGTLTHPILDFSQIRRVLRCPPLLPVLEHIQRLPPDRQAAAHQILDRFEIEAAERCRPNEDAEEVVASLLRRGIKLGIISRNSLRAISRSLENFGSIRPSDFAVVISREDPYPPKPDPASVREAARRMELDVREVLMVGDYLFDIEAGQKAGARTVLLTNARETSDPGCSPDLVITRLKELLPLVDRAAPLLPGKLPSRFLDEFLPQLRAEDPLLLVGPRTGEDFAAVRTAGKEVLVLKSDPVTFATDSIGTYVVLVAANDVATSGALPRWLLTSLLFPVGSSAEDVRQVLREIHQTAERHGLVLCGGHTEITEAVNRPVVVAQAAGLMSEADLILKQRVREGDSIVLTKRVAVEGTSIIAREFAELLKTGGMSEEEIARARRFLEHPGISILPEARLAAGRCSALHDVTEGGLATALEELSRACGRRLRVFLDRIPVFPETDRICGLTGLNPLGVIGSGSLLICCDRTQSAPLIEDLRRKEIEATEIGTALEKGSGVEAVRHGKAAEWPEFEVDEIARLFRGPAPSAPSR
jgi:hydrogenase expression/formation protein HypE